LAFSNCAASLYDHASTFHRAFGLSIGENTVTKQLIKKVSQYQWLIIDEYSMVPDIIWGYLSLIKSNTKCNILLSGDHRQLPPIITGTDSLQLVNKPDIFNNPIVNSIHDNNTIELNYSNRVNDLYYLGYLLDTKSYNYKALLKLGVNDGGELSPYSIVCFNKTRISVNKFWVGDRMDKQGRIKTINIGDQLICIENNQGKQLIKNKHYIVNSVKPLTISVDMNIHDTYQQLILDSTSDLKYFDFGYAFTVWKTQGCTIKVPISILDTDVLFGKTGKFDEDLRHRIVYTAMTRVSSPQNISFGTI
jgi:ATP-dependent exoDNAse (exonuclease V) alpha subunit